MIPNPIYLYHITHVSNLPKIIQAGGLKPKSQVNDYLNIAHNAIQEKRSDKKVSCEPGGTLHQYVPFYFCTRSPMLYTISQGNVSEYDGGQEQVIYLVSTVEKVDVNSLKYAFTDGHPIMAISEFYNDLKNIGYVNFELMNEQWWNDTDEKPDRKRQRQAEFLVYKFFPWQLIAGIAVKTSTLLAEVNKIIEEANPQYKPKIAIKQNWYY